MRSFCFVLLIIGGLYSCKASDPSGYAITVSLLNQKSGDQIHLQCYHGKALAAIDSFFISDNKVYTFRGNTSLQPGMYALSLNKTVLANFFISDNNNRNFTISLDVQNPASSLTFLSSPENQAFVDYLRFLGTRQHPQAEIIQKGEQLQKQFPGTMLALFIQTMKEPQVPEPTKSVSDPIEYKYGYLANHYFDNVRFSDQRLLNTPLLEQKISFFFMQMVPPLPDSIIERVDETLEKAKASNEVYNWTVRYLYNLYREAPIAGNTEVYNYIGENYIITDPNRWNDVAFVEKVRSRVAKAGLNPVGEKATNLVLQSPEGKKIDLYSIKANYTVLFFYNPECEACKPVSAALSEFSKQYRSKGVEVFAVYMDQKQEVWKAAIATKGQNWINGFDPKGPAKIEEGYDLYALPMIYLLDSNKKVFAKDVPFEKLKTLLK